MRAWLFRPSGSIEFLCFQFATPNFPLPPSLDSIAAESRRRQTSSIYTFECSGASKASSHHPPSSLTAGLLCQRLSTAHVISRQCPTPPRKLFLPTDGTPAAFLNTLIGLTSCVCVSSFWGTEVRELPLDIGDHDRLQLTNLTYRRTAYLPQALCEEGAS